MKKFLTYIAIFGVSIFIIFQVLSLLICFPNELRAPGGIEDIFCGVPPQVPQIPN